MKKEPSAHAPLEQGTRNAIIAGIYNLQAALGVRPRSVNLLCGCPRSGTSAMRNWLQLQPGVAALFESRILISAHRFVEEVERFALLHANKNILLPLIRRLVFSYCARTKLIWHRHLVLKEPLEPIAFPDERYGDFLKGVRAIFPGIKIIFMIRDPVGTIWSMTQRKWGYSLTSRDLKSYSLDESIRIWQVCADLACEYASDSNVYLCMFDKLIGEPEEESRRVFDFLSIDSKKFFLPKATKTPGFSEEEQNFIIEQTRPQMELLTAIKRGGLNAN